MSRLIYKGNTINNFGRHLPVPYIERIEIRNIEYDEITHPVVAATVKAQAMAAGTTPTAVSVGGGATKTTLYLALLFNTDDDFNVDLFKQEIFNELDLNILLIPSPPMIEDLRNSKRHLKTTLNTIKDSEALSIGSAQYKRAPLNDFLDEVAWTSDYDEDMNTVIRTTNIVIELEPYALKIFLI